MTSPAGPLELEAALIVVSYDPQSIAESIEGLASIDGYLLLPRSSQHIHDRYFDTLDGDLGSRKIALRMREVNGINLVTLKGPSRHGEREGVAERLEIEKNWSKESMDYIIKEIRRQEIEVCSSPEASAYAQLDYNSFIKIDPAEIMGKCGLEVIQDRHTYRKIRNVVSKRDKSGNVLAELAIDYGIFYFRGQGIRYQEIEIEAKSEYGRKAIEDIQKSLLDMYPSKIRQWKYSKLEMGMAIDKLIEEERGQRIVDDQGNLRPEAYDKIDDYMKR